MTTYYITMPDEMFSECEKFAEELGVTPSELICQALSREIDLYNARKERAAIAKAFKAMKSEPTRATDSEETDSVFSETLPDEKDFWWKGKA